MTTKPASRIAIMCANASCQLRKECRRATSEPTDNQKWAYYWPQEGVCPDQIKK